MEDNLKQKVQEPAPSVGQLNQVDLINGDADGDDDDGGGLQDVIRLEDAPHRKVEAHLIGIRGTLHLKKTLYNPKP